MARDAKPAPPSLVRQKLFRATAGMTVHDQSVVASALATSGNNVLEVYVHALSSCRGTLPCL
ncbi:hypothetical protein, variant [Aphanomyces invadans]|uniref:Uncharacterized protein n=1 Tax=Aphanomyces invadans TaxID=157072 RepID=A0A024TF24_9STRA|nr:hypothetical protein, variant [Aphanomyces invadans]ETV92765.1 hypothetical protein, variant [Aphanomyces invadans]|eukprot:XP_008878534.1 hypothetical protein, variant [Aphanomyces invadans]